jgi:hypothetical protein
MLNVSVSRDGWQVLNFLDCSCRHAGTTMRGGNSRRKVPEDVCTNGRFGLLGDGPEGGRDAGAVEGDVEEDRSDELKAVDSDAEESGD